MKNRLANLIITLFIGSMMLLFLLFPTVCIEGATEGLLLWFHKLLPSLLPFMILMNLLCLMGVILKFGHALTRFTQKLFKISGNSLIIFLLGLMGGYPMGAKLTKQLLDTKQISFDEASKTLCFGTQCGPLFIIGTVGTLMLGNTSLGYFLLTVHISSACVMLLLSRFYASPYTSRIAYTPLHSPGLPLSEAFTHSVQNAMDTIVYVGGYIIFFSVIIHLVRDASLFHTFTAKLSTLLPLSAPQWEALLLGSLEFSNGAFLASKLAPLSLLNLGLLSALLAFGGFCVFFQCIYVLQGSSLPLSTYLTAKCFQAGIAFCLTFLLAPFFTLPLPVSPTSLPLFLLFILCFLCAITFRYLSKKGDFQ
ncbi:MAG: hypothetical protein ACRDDX_09950 [Cellulosilyticaceae bacterium]